MSLGGLRRRCSRRDASGRMTGGGEGGGGGGESVWSSVAHIDAAQAGGISKIRWLSDSSAFATSGFHSRHVRLWWSPLKVVEKS